MTKQQAYDTICAGLAQQKRRSVNETGKCLYRGPDGLKCAVGHLISDELYDPEMERYSVLIDVMERANIPQGLMGLLSELQDDHDASCLSDDICDNLRATAERHGIKPGAEEAITEWTA